MIDFAPKKLPELMERIRGYKLVANDPFDALSSLTYHLEKIQYNKETRVIHNHSELHSVIVMQAETEEQKNQRCIMPDLRGNVMTGELVINLDTLTRSELEGYQKLFSNAILVNHELRQDKGVYD